MALISEILGSDRTNRDEVLSKLHNFGSGADPNQIYADEHPESEGKLPAYLFEPEEPADPLLEAGEPEPLLEAHYDDSDETDPYAAYPTPFDEPSYEDMNADELPPRDDARIAEEAYASAAAIAERETAVQRGGHANELHEEASPEGAEALREANMAELSDLVQQLALENLKIRNGASFDQERRSHYDDMDARTTELFKSCHDGEGDVETLTMFAKFLNSTKPEAGVDYSALRSPLENPVEFTKPGSSEPTFVETASAPVEVLEDKSKYPVGSLVNGEYGGVVRADWRVKNVRERDGRTLYDIVLDETGEILPALDENTLDVFQKREVTADSETHGVREELHELGDEIREKVSTKTGEIMLGMAEVRDYYKNRAAEKKREWLDDGGRELLKLPFRGAEIGKRWGKTLLDPYHRFKDALSENANAKDVLARASADLTVGLIKSGEAAGEQFVKFMKKRMSDRSDRNMIEGAGKSNEQKNMELARKFIMGGTLLYAGYRLAMSARGLETSGFIDQLLTPGGVGSGGGGNTLGGGAGVPNVLETTSPSPVPVESFDTDQFKGTGVTVEVVPQPSESPSVLETQAPSTAPSPLETHSAPSSSPLETQGSTGSDTGHDVDSASSDTAPSHDAAPDNHAEASGHAAESLPHDAYVIHSGDGPINTVERLNGDTTDWDKMKDQYYDKFKGTGLLYREGNDVRYNHQGKLPAKMVEFMAEKVKEYHGR